MMGNLKWSRIIRRRINSPFLKELSRFCSSIDSYWMTLFKLIVTVNWTISNMLSKNKRHIGRASSLVTKLFNYTMERKLCPSPFQPLLRNISSPSLSNKESRKQVKLYSNKSFLWINSVYFILLLLTFFRFN